MQWVMTAVAASALPGSTARAEPRVAPGAAGVTPAPAATPHGYGVDPNLVKGYQPGDFWPLTFSEAQRKSTAALVDTIIPSDDLGPAASAVGVVEMIDEWISAPYPQQQGDRPIILEGLAWIEAESDRRFKKPFAELSGEQRRAICDDICLVSAARPPLAIAAKFFAHFRDLCASAYYATPEGWKAIGYVGNVPLDHFDGPPPEVLEKLGVTQTVQ